MVLITVPSGHFIGFASATSTIIDQEGAGLWGAATGWRKVDSPAPFSEREFYGRVVRLGHIHGRKNVRTDKPGERVDSRILEPLIELEDGKELSPGIRVDTFILTSTHAATVGC